MQIARPLFYKLKGIKRQVTILVFLHFTFSYFIVTIFNVITFMPTNKIKINLTKILALTLGLFILWPSFALAATKIVEPQEIKEFKEYDLSATTANAILVQDVKSGKNLLDYNSDKVWSAASLTKLMSALVFLDQGISFSARTKLKAGDSVGGAELSANGYSLSARDLFNCSLMASTNNTVSALVRLSGLSKNNFVKRMNKKAKVLGMTSSTFVEPTGMDSKNLITAKDVTKLAITAFSNYNIRTVSARKNYTLSVKINRKFKTIKNVNKLLFESRLDIVGGKTGLLDESQYNFTTIIRGPKNSRIAVTVLGANTWNDLFNETQKLADWATANWQW
jgi:D-alanyl-D-alanine endopeptidase (penicillin-binding protein 7)